MKIWSPLILILIGLLTGCSKPGAPILPSPEPSLSIPSTDEVVLTLHNNQPYSGIAGEGRPGWVGWGAQAFAISPNGNFWILDYAAQPQRLVQLDSRSNILKIIPLDGLAQGATDVEAAGDAIWVLGIASQPPQVVKLSAEGGLVSSYDLPKGLWPEDGLSGIALGQDGTLLVELEGGARLYQLFNQNDEVSPLQLQGYTFGGRLFHVSKPSMSKEAEIYAGDETIFVHSPLPIGALRVIGSTSNGDFYAEMYVMPEELGSRGERLILRYSTEGVRLGIAYPRPAEFYAKQDVIVGPDGFVYQLVSNPDHSVQVVRLGFKTGEIASSAPSAMPTVAPTALLPLLPTWTVTPEGVSDEEIARQTLLSYFTLLHDGRYAEAATLFGGSYDTLRVQNPDIPANDYPALWKAACTRQMHCMVATHITAEELVTADEYKFLVMFVREDGTLFELGPCCGATEAEMPPVWQFPYTVIKTNDQYRVMEEPVYIP